MCVCVCVRTRVMSYMFPFPSCYFYICVLTHATKSVIITSKLMDSNFCLTHHVLVMNLTEHSEISKSYLMNLIDSFPGSCTVLGI
jgi:hypothetical protein